MKNKILFLAIFILLGFLALQLPVNYLAASKVKFTLFDLFAPVSGAFLGSAFGVLAVFLMQLGNLVVHGFSGVDSSSPLKLIVTLRFLPVLFGVWYFANVTKLSFWGRAKRGLQNQNEDSGQVLRPGPRARMTLLNSTVLIAPALAIIAFNLHPIGRTVWYYSLFWTIPYLVLPLTNRFLLLRSLGSTFTAHAVGGAVWIWAFNMPASVWQSLIPIVFLERALFALGISASYLLINNILGFLSSKNIIKSGVKFDKKYFVKF